ncbi:PQQ-like beta-propeller repeat protein [Actinoplanes sp. KI2]|uniref:PQQ-like beta-propeller repeat protein n=1 Tax=Actinoplanes sp. KI2 TaxID=2983315 RepID=UPI0021D5E5AE|nr:PQQ-like beta-propeller repeat protein [Actinoplanes sp. KI2]MCU7724266.1 PQQ-like beta-propeller repeat protein [Actinoplanes sp. KI2]
MLALVIAGLAVPAAATAAPVNEWPQYGQNALHTSTNPAETAFTSQNIANVKVVSKAHFDDNGQNHGGPVVVGGRLYITDFDGDLSVFASAGCGADSCEPLWTAHIDGSIDSSPAVAGGVVFVASTNVHALFAFPAAGCGAATCRPLWTGRMLDGATGSVTVADGIAYVGDFTGHLYAFRATGCGRASCAPLWTGAGATNENLHTAAAGNGYVYVDSFQSTPELFTGRLLAFPAAGCGSATCKPTWTADLGGPGTGVAISGSTVFAGSSTLFGDGVNTDYHLMAFAGGGCGHAVCKPLRSYFTGGFGVEGGLAIAGNTLLASDNDTIDPQFIGGVFAYPLAGCGQAQCQPTWMGLSFATAPSSPPVVVGDVVLVGKGPASGFPVDSGFFSYPLRGCGATVCQPIALLQLGEQMGYLGGPLAVADHKIFMASTDNTDGHTNVYTAALT